jgi:hypothetical protein
MIGSMVTITIQKKLGWGIFSFRRPALAGMDTASAFGPCDFAATLARLPDAAHGPLEGGLGFLGHTSCVERHGS